jgi:hypothetical protein
MKQRVLAGALVGFACILMLAGSAVAQGGQLVAAEYGAGGRRVDVTGRVREFLHNGVLRFDVNDQMLGVDPARNHVKELFIRVRYWDGKEEEFRYPEYAHVNLEMDPDVGYDYRERGLHIMRAYYGGEGAFANVTEQLRSMVRDGRLFVFVDNRNMGIDPDPHVRKVLRVLYWFEGERRQIVVPEKTELRLP